MSKCEQTRSRITFYLDNELEASECAAIEAHLSRCEACTAVFQNEQRFLELVRESAAGSVAPAELRTRVEEVLKVSSVVSPAPPALRQRVQGLLRRQHRMSGGSAPHLIPRWALAVVAIMAIALFAGLWRRHNRFIPVPIPAPSDFAVMAASTHQRHILGRLPLEIISDVPGDLSQWFAGKVPFLLKLPNYQESSGQEKLYRLEGARLVSYKNDYAAYVAYQMHSRPISLVVTSDAVAQASGGEQIVAKQITFHYNSINGLKVITWSDRGLTYALVSNLEERGQESCIVCHQGSKDRDFIESLKPR